MAVVKATKILKKKKNRSMGAYPLSAWSLSLKINCGTN